MIKNLFLIFVVTFIACSSNKRMAFDPKQENSNYIEFGGGGGFTGKVNTYYLTNEGILYVQQGEVYSKLASISKVVTNQVYNNFTTLGLDKTILNDPGNKYSFIGRTVNGESKMIKWGNSQLDNKSIQIYFNILMKLVKDNTKIQTQSN